MTKGRSGLLKSRLLKHSFRLLNQNLNRFGYTVTRRQPAPPFDVRLLGNNPYSRLYARSATTILLELRLADARDPTCLPMGPGHPFVDAVAAGITQNSPNGIADALAQYYAANQPLSAAEQLGIPVEAFAKTPAWAFVWPWESSSITQKMARAQNANRKAAEKTLGVADLHIAHGWKFAGPVSDLMLRNETSRLWTLLQSIRNNGYQRHNGKSGDIEGVALEDGTGRFRWSISSGNHRVAVLSVLGHESVPVRIHGIVRRQDAAIWPNVVSGLFSPAEATAVFDQLFEGSRQATAGARISATA